VGELCAVVDIEFSEHLAQVISSRVGSGTAPLLRLAANALALLD
jgi:hypothetical protein